MKLNNHRNILVQNVLMTIHYFNMLSPHEAVLLGVSGGSDSVALFHIMLEIKTLYNLRLGVAHVNHGLRDEADQDEFFVKQLADQAGIPFYSVKKNVLEHKLRLKESIEEAGRTIRYAFFEQISHDHGFSKIALGHHADDNAEQVLMQIIRGTGVKGLSGIPPVRDKWIIRPLIQSRKQQLIQYLHQNSLDFVIDSSNNDNQFLRNRIRNELLPLLEHHYNPNIYNGLNRLADICLHEENWLEPLIQNALNHAMLYHKSHDMCLSLPILQSYHRGMRRRMIRKVLHEIKPNGKQISFDHIDQIDDLIQKKEGVKTIDLPNDIYIRKDQAQLFFIAHKKVSHSDKKKLPYLFMIEKIGPIHLSDIGLFIEMSKLSFQDVVDITSIGGDLAVMDYDQVVFPLMIRNWQPGDRFCPLGINGTQKIKKYFINQKIPVHKRVGCPVLISQNTIIWLIGHRISNRVRLTSKTQNVLRFEVKHNNTKL